MAPNILCSSMEWRVCRCLLDLTLMRERGSIHKWCENGQHKYHSHFGYDEHVFWFLAEHEILSEKEATFTLEVTDLNQAAAILVQKADFDGTMASVVAICEQNTLIFDGAPSVGESFKRTQNRFLDDHTRSLVDELINGLVALGYMVDLGQDSDGISCFALTDQMASAMKVNYLWSD